jgi:glycine/D-amino acid oxidase-like deaminating enzyme
MNLNERMDLRGGRACWRDGARSLSSDPLPQNIDVLVVGAGIMGAMVAERLAASGRGVAVVDRRSPVEGATAGSTALVMWAADVPLSHLAKSIGVNEASKRWRHVFAGVEQLDQRIARLNLDCGWINRPEIYLSGDLLDDDDIAAEAKLRQAAQLPSIYSDAATIGERFDILPRSGLVSDGSFEVDPVALSFGMLEAARRSGAAISFPVHVERFETDGAGVRVFFANGGDIHARTVVLATGYEPARLYLPAAFELSSSYAIASKPGIAPLWRENALIWEASDPYLYARSTTDGRIVVGGEDEDFDDPIKRDELIGKKSGALQSKARAMLNSEDIEFECAWASTFGGSPDGLPAIGRARHADNIWLAYGYGGNGVTFASVAAGLLEAALGGQTSEADAWFDPYRFER